MAEKSRVKLTKTVVGRMGQNDVLWDSDVRGFGVRCQRQAKNYVLKTRVNGRQRWFTIGSTALHGPPTRPVRRRWASWPPFTKAPICRL